MQKWEYLQIYSRYADERFVLYANGELLSAPEDKPQGSWEFLNKYGEQGWELVQHTASEWMLKRPKS
jgi:hypothetical protein